MAYYKVLQLQLLQVRVDKRSKEKGDWLGLGRSVHGWTKDHGSALFSLV